MQTKIQQFLYFPGVVLTFAGVVFQMNDKAVSFYIFSFGALLLIVSHFLYALNHKTKDKRQERLSRISFVSSLFLIIAAYFMFTASNSWVVFVLIYALISLFTSYRIR